MTVTLPLAQMTNAEKLELIQVIWEDLDKRQIPSPDWHEEVLMERERLIASGEETFMDWEEAKAELAKKFE